MEGRVFCLVVGLCFGGAMAGSSEGGSVNDRLDNFQIHVDGAVVDVRIEDSRGRRVPCEDSSCVGIPGGRRMPLLSREGVMLAVFGPRQGAYRILAIGTGGSVAVMCYVYGKGGLCGGKTDRVDAGAGEKLEWSLKVRHPHGKKTCQVALERVRSKPGRREGR
jgi:hypothetical protein